MNWEFPSASFPPCDKKVHIPSEETAKETFEQWKARMEKEIEEKILANPSFLKKLRDVRGNSLPYHSWNRSVSSSSPNYPPQHSGEKLKCPICGEQRRLTKHHITPTEVAHLVSVNEGTIQICRLCHDGVHLEFTNIELTQTAWIEVVRRVRIRLSLLVPCL